MNKAAAKMTTTGSSPGKKPDNDGWVIAIQFLDVTWRVALPILILSYIGIRLDRYFNTKPMWSLIGFFSSLLVSSSLVIVQINKAYPDFFKRGDRK